MQQELFEQLTEERRVYLNRVNISTQQLVALMENLLSVAMIEGGVFPKQICCLSGRGVSQGWV